MKAVVLDHYGSPAELRLEDVPTPVPDPGEVLVRVRATTINDWDWCFTRGRPYPYRLLFGWTRPGVRILGSEVAGVVEATGSSASKFREGDAVYGDLSEAGFGGFAEYVAVRESALASMPSGLSFEQAAALPHAAGLARQGLVDVGGIRRGERVLINGAGGGVGMLGVQIAKRYDAEVTGVDRGSKLDALRELGFDHVVDYETVDFTRAAERYDLILDAKTTRAPRRYLRALAPGGRYVTVGGSIPRLIQLLVLAPLLGRLSGKALSIVALKPNQDLARLDELLEPTAIRFHLDGPYPLSEVPRAMQRFGDAQHRGKIVIQVAAS